MHKSISVFDPQLSPKPSLTADGQVSSPASVNSSTDPSSQLTQADGPAPCQDDVKMEVKKQEEEDEGDDSQDDVKGKMGKCHPEAKTEEKPEVRLSMTFTGTNFFTLKEMMQLYVKLHRDISPKVL